MSVKEGNDVLAVISEPRQIGRSRLNKGWSTTRLADTFWEIDNRNCLRNQCELGVRESPLPDIDSL